MRPPTVAGILILLVAAAIIAGIWVADGFVSADGDATAPVEAQATVEGPQAIVAVTSNMYGAPTRTGELIAIVPEGRAVRVTGRTDDSSWIRVIYPVNSTLEGWVAATNFVTASMPDLAAVPDVASVTEGGDAGGGLLDDPALPNLTVSSAEVGADGELVVRVTNIGREAFSGSLGLSVTTAEGEIVGVLDVDLSASLLSPGRSASVNTGVEIATTGLYIIEVDPSNEIDEASEFDNARRILLVSPGQ